MKPLIVLSGVNFIEAGPLAIFRDALRSLAHDFSDRYEIVALVHRRDLFDIDGITYIEFPEIKSSWLRRLWFEYWSCREISRQLRPYLWLSMHDITPNVSAAIRAVYCHNPAPFHRMSTRLAVTDGRLTLFTLFYRFLYAINLQQNQFVIVQQDWIRKEFERRYGVRSVVVAHPALPHLPAPQPLSTRPPNGHHCRFFYPAYPRSFKNFEVILEAARLLQQRGTVGFEIWLTLSGKENRYSAGLRVRFNDLQSVRWLGVLPREQVFNLYTQADCLIFPSLLETWGMPISEFQQTGKPMLVADLPYAHETVGTYEAVRFFSPNHAELLADMMAGLIAGSIQFTPATARPIPHPFASGWPQLFRILLGENGGPESTNALQ